MAAKPIVDGIEQEHASSLRVIRLNVQEPAARALAEQFDFRFTPTFILFDLDGNEVQRWVGAIDARQVREQLVNLDV